MRKALYWKLFNFKINFKSKRAPIILAFLRQYSPLAQKADKIKAALNIQRVCKRFRWRVIKAQRLSKAYLKIRRAREECMVLMWRKIERKIAEKRRLKIVKRLKKHHEKRSAAQREKEINLAAIQARRIIGEKTILEIHLWEGQNKDTHN